MSEDVTVRIGADNAPLLQATQQAERAVRTVMANAQRASAGARAAQSGAGGGKDFAAEMAKSSIASDALRVSTMVLGRTFGFSSEMALSAIRGVKEFSKAAKETGGVGSAAKAALLPLGKALAAMGPVGWIAAGALALAAGAMLLMVRSAEKAQKQLREFTQTAAEFSSLLDQASKAKFGGTANDKRTQELEQAIAAAEARVAWQKKKIGEAKRDHQKDEVFYREMEIDHLTRIQIPSMKRLVEAHLATEKAAQAAESFTQRSMATKSTSYLKSNDYLKQQITLTTEQVRAIYAEQQAILKEIGARKQTAENTKELNDLEEKRMGLLSKRRELQDQIVENDRKASEEAAKPEKERAAAVAEIIKDLEKQAKTYQATAREAAIYSLETAKATKAEVEQAKVLLDLYEKREKEQKALEESKDATKTLTDDLKRLKDEILRLSGATDSQLKIIDLDNLVKAHPELKKLADELRSLYQARDRATQLGDMKREAEAVKEGLKTPAEKMQEQLNKLKGMAQAGLLTQDQYQQAAKNLQPAERADTRGRLEGLISTWERIQAAAAGGQGDPAVVAAKEGAAAAKHGAAATDRVAKATDTATSVLGQILTLLQDVGRKLPLIGAMG
jgi:hypothetical protein